jgi:hypothetical protein
MVQAVLRLTQHIRVSPIRRLFGFGITVSGLVLLVSDVIGQLQQSAAWAGVRACALVRDLMTALVHLP